MKNSLRISMSSGVIALALVLGGCQSFGKPIFTDDFGTKVDDQSDLSTKVKAALRASPRTAVNNIYVTKTGDDTVKLSGQVDSDATSYAAEEVAESVEGVRHVFNSLQIED